jgi:hypothetical protein
MVDRHWVIKGATLSGDDGGDGVRHRVAGSRACLGIRAGRANRDRRADRGTLVDQGSQVDRENQAVPGIASKAGNHRVAFPDNLIDILGCAA